MNHYHGKGEREEKIPDQLFFRGEKTGGHKENDTLKIIKVHRPSP